MKKAPAKLAALLFFIFCLAFAPAALAEDDIAGLSADFMNIFAPESQRDVSLFLSVYERDYLRQYQTEPGGAKAGSALAELAARDPNHPLLRYLRLILVTDRSSREFAVLLRPLLLPYRWRAVEETLFIYDHLDSPPAEYEAALDKNFPQNFGGLFERERYLAGRSGPDQWVVFL